MDSDDIKRAEQESGTRTRQLTEKGLNYNLEMKQKNFHRLFKSLSVKSDELNELMCSDANVTEVKERYKKWMTEYELFLECTDEIRALLSSEEKQIFDSTEYVHKDVYLRNVNLTVENWFSLRQPKMVTPDNVTDTEHNPHIKDNVSDSGRSQRSGSSRRSKSSIASSISSARVAQEQKQAELEAKAATFKKKQQLDLAKFKLEMEQEELVLQTELAISEAKRKVLSKFEQSQYSEEIQSDIHTGFNQDQVLDTNVKNTQPSFNFTENLTPQDTRHLIDNHPSQQDTVVHSHISKLNPHVEPFTPNTHLTENTAFLEEKPAYTKLKNPVNYPSSEDMLLSVVRHMNTPPPELKKFNGDQLEYKKFCRQFHSKIVENTESNNDRLMYLDQFTTGEPNRIVSTFAYMDAEEGFPSAMRELEKRYGNNDMLAAAFIQRAFNWPVVKSDNPKSLDDFGKNFSECGQAIKSISAVKVLEYPDNLKKLVSKLPYYFHDKWRNIIQRNRETSQDVRFSQLVDFVQLEARKAMDPIYGKDALRPENTTSPRIKSKVVKSKGSYVTQVSDRRTETNNTTNSDSTYTEKPKSPAFNTPCLFCTNSNHTLRHCEKIFSLPYQERIDFLKIKGLCYGCLRTGHQRMVCRNKATCKHCKGRHPSICHVDGKPPQIFYQNKDKQDTTASASLTIPTETVHSSSSERSDCTMAIIPVSVKLNNGMKVLHTYAFLDPGSTATFCTEKLFKELGGTGKPCKITLDTMGQRHTMKTFAVNNIEIGDLNLQNVIQLPKVFTKDKMPVSASHIPTSKDVSRWSHLNDIDIPEITEDIGLLIGNNVPDAYAPVEVRTGQRGSPHATRSLLGWILWNVVRDQSSHIESSCCLSVNRTAVVAVQELEDLKYLDRKVQESIRLDFPEHLIDDQKEPSQNDRKFKDKVNSSIELIGGQYCISLPFKSEDFKFPNNENQARKRLNSLKSKLSSNSKFCEDYTAFMDSMIEKGYAEQVPDSELIREDGKTWYIPHHGVYHHRKPNKIRVVFDCSVTYQGACLNTALLQGPDLTNNLLGVLIRFRQENIAVMGDVESMFYRVKVPKEDADCLRFLWWPQGDLQQEPSTYRMQVHIFGAISSPSCANTALRKTAEDNLQKFNPEITDTIIRNFYVDDCLVSVDSESKAIDLVRDVTHLCELGGFQLTKWISTSRKVIDSIPVDRRAKEVQKLSLDSDDLPNERVLGVHWVTEKDTFSFDIGPRDSPCTRRGILSMVSAVFDPLGFASPFVLIGKLILQDLCRKRVDWDELATGENHKNWQKWLQELPLLKNIVINRCYKSAELGHIISHQIHAFSDASEIGYGVAIYMRLIDEHFNTHVTLIMAKSRVAPLKKVTVPRMELTAATMAVRLCRMLIRELDYNIDQIKFWTDSMSVLRYINNETTRFQTFVANRIAVIRDGSDPQQWSYVPSKLNIADIASRGSHLDKFLHNKAWFNGPEFLSQPESEWPETDHSLTNLSEDDPEIKKAVGASVMDQSSSVLDTIISRCSDWFRLKSTLGWVLFAIDRFKSLAASHNLSRNNKPTSARELKHQIQHMNIDLSYLQSAEMILVKHVQAQHFQKELDILTDPKCVNMVSLPKSSSVRRLDPFVSDDGLLRVGGRLSQADIPYESRHPIILPREGISNLYLEHVHKNIGHLGKNSMLNTVRQKYWIIRAPSSIKSLVKRCITCRRYQAKVGEQKMADLPPERLLPDQPPFSSVGVDYFGPFEIQRGRSIVKRYGAIFTCLASRAVHLEVASTLDTDSCICAIRRLIARRGPVKLIRSDNGTNLVGSERELREELQKWNQAKINKTLQQQNVKWIFNPPTGSHHGGIWERITRIVRKILYSLLRQQTRHLDDELLITLFCEVESILNNRPITEITHDYRDLDALTPNHLLLVRSGEILPPGLFDKSDNYSNRRWRNVQYLCDIFWRRWTLEYLPLLQERQKWLHPKRNLQRDDLVLVVDNTPRNSWCLGRVMDTTKDRLGLVRSVTVKTKSTTLIRPVDKLCLLLEADNVKSNED